MSLWYRDVTLGRRGVVALLTVLLVQWVLSTGVSAQTLIIPSLTVSERYDSNVFWTPKSLLASNRTPEDFATTVTPQINVAHTGSQVSGSIFVAGLITRYQTNSNLDYTGINTGGLLDLKGWANSFSQRITQLSVRGTYQFAPSASGFGASTANNNGLGVGIGSNSGGLLNTGLVTNRVAMNRYNLGVGGGYQLAPTTTLSGAFNYSKISFGNQFESISNPLFSTTGYQGSTTIATGITARDTVGASAFLSHYSQQGSSNGSSGSGSFTTIAETLNWNRLWTEKMTTFLSAGGNVTLPVGSSVPGHAVPLLFAPTFRAGMTYSSFSEALREAGSSLSPYANLPSLEGSISPGGIMAPGAYVVSVLSTYSISPSYAFGSGPMKTLVAGVTASGGITSNLSGQVGVNYAHGVRDLPASTFDSVAVTAGALYLIGPVLATLTYNYIYFSNSIDQASLNTISLYQYSKEMVMLSFTYAFMSPSFFRMGEFGSSGTQGSTGGVSAPSGAGTESRPSGDGSGILRKE